MSAYYALISFILSFLCAFLGLRGHPGLNIIRPDQLQYPAARHALKAGQSQVGMNLSARPPKARVVAHLVREESVLRHQVLHQPVDPSEVVQPILRSRVHLDQQGANMSKQARLALRNVEDGSPLAPL